MKKLLFSSTSLQISSPPKKKLTYPPITQSRQIRIVRILSGSRFSKISCELQLASLDHNLPEYIALSYCWGNATQKTWIDCNGGRLAVTKDLLTALRRFRRKDKIVTFWIDQICIDQENVEERSSQIQLMRDIYKNAQTVYVWIGDEADDSSLAITFMQRLLETLRNCEPTMNANEMHTRGVPDWMSKEWKVLSAFLGRPWFGRMWILQELAVASSATIFCGQVHVPWNTFLELITRMRATQCWNLIPRAQTLETTGMLQDRLSSIIAIKRDYEENATITSREALWRCRHFDATDPRDKFYALLGLCAHDQITVADYSRDVLNVYREVAVDLLFPKPRKNGKNGKPVTNSHQIMG
ncbi:hypothetical protein MMC28_010888 [Mycoblastus sanguinarius]|nr:hypothetical protein [Mycoblastus sanguinarius]